MARQPKQPHRTERGDPTGRESWKRIVEWRRPDGSLDAALVHNRDGSTVVSHYGPGERERHTVTLADGRSFVVETDGATQTISTADGRVVSRTTGTPDGPVAEPVVQPVYVGPDPTIGIVTLGTLFLALSATNDKAQLRRLKELCRRLALDDRAGLAALLHEWEAATVKNLKLEKYWQPTPFPLELQAG